MSCFSKGLNIFVFTDSTLLQDVFCPIAWDAVNPPDTFIFLLKATASPLESCGWTQEFCVAAQPLMLAGAPAAPKAAQLCRETSEQPATSPPSRLLKLIHKHFDSFTILLAPLWPESMIWLPDTNKKTNKQDPQQQKTLNYHFLKKILVAQVHFTSFPGQ